MNVSIRQAYCKEACYLYGKTKYFAYECFNQKAQIRAVLCTMTSKERQAQADEVRELDESNAEEEQLAEKVPLEEDFTDV